jgi:hypothetical protein
MGEKQERVRKKWREGWRMRRNQEGGDEKKEENGEDEEEEFFDESIVDKEKRNEKNCIDKINNWEMHNPEIAQVRTQYGVGEREEERVAMRVDIKNETEFVMAHPNERSLWL